MQNPAAATKMLRLKKQDGLIDRSRSASKLQPNPRVSAVAEKFHLAAAEGSPEMRLILESVQPLDESAASSLAPSGHASGEIIFADGDTLIVRCGQAPCAPRLQPAGKRLMTAAEFLRGYPLHAGQRFEQINDSRLL